jgi:hypothetical protein
MATYPPIIGGGALVSAKQHRMNKIYGTTTAANPVRKYQTKGPNMFKRMIKGLVTWSLSERHQEDIQISDRAEEVRISASGIRFEVYRANGGTVIETRRNDRRSGDSIYELHVIAGDQDIGEEIGKIITMEALKA